jgi:hypothetical protein
VFNVGSPYNVPAGSRVNLDKVIAHYEKMNSEVDVERERAKERQARRDEAVKKAYAERKSLGEQASKAAAAGQFGAG